MQIKSITLGSYRRAKQCIAEIENQKDTKRHLKNELEKNNMIDQDTKETIKKEINFLGDNIERFKMELRRIEKNAFGLDWVGTFPEDDVIDAKDHAVNEYPTEEFEPVPSEMINKAKEHIQKILSECERLKTFVDLISCLYCKYDDTDIFRQENETFKNVIQWLEGKENENQ